MAKKTLLLLGFLLITQNIFSQNIKATSELYNQCSIAEKTSEEYMNATFCLGYMTGFIDSYQLVDGLNKTKNLNSSSLACLPNNGTDVDFLRILFLYYVNKYPDSLDKSARVTLMKALIAAYPCKQ